MATEGEHTTSEDVRTGLITLHSGTTAVQYSVVDGMAMFEGDIILGNADAIEEQTEALRAAGDVIAFGVVVSDTRRRWPDCRVPFTIDPSLPDKERVTDAIAHWEAKTNYRFPARTSSDVDFVTFRPANGCSAMVGRQGGQQFVNLGPNCTTGNAIHEIGHAVGLWHEQSRQDRDLFVRINWPKIATASQHNFNQHITDGDDVGTYDYESIMHYPRTAFSIDGSDTVVPTNPPTAQIGQRNGLSAGDVAAANSLCTPRRARVRRRRSVRSA